MTGSPGNPGPDGKTGSAVRQYPALLSSFVHTEIHFSFNLPIREPLDKMAALDHLDLLELEVSLESWDSLDPKELL